MKKLVAYVRVSTKKQGDSGLGLDGQRAAVESYAKQSGAEVVAWYTEVESGKRSDRPQLAKALAHARRIKAVLVVGKLDRLSRNVAFLANLMESNVEFVACDNPAANKLTLHVLAAVAQAEAEAISGRTTAALDSYKRKNMLPKWFRELKEAGKTTPEMEAEMQARAGKLGAELPQCRNLTQEAREKGAQAAGEAARRNADEAYGDLLPLVVRLRNEGKTLQQIAEALNAEGHTTRRGKPFGHVQVLRLLDRTAV